MKANRNVGIMERWKRVCSPYCVFVLLFFMLFSSCEKDFITPEQPGAKKMVINCLLNTHRTLIVFVSQSADPMGTGGLKPVTDAVVELYSNDSLLQVLPFAYTDSAKTFGAYRWIESPEPSKKYSVRVIHAMYGVVTAHDVVPVEPAVTNYQLISYADSFPGAIAKFRFQLHDNGSEENFYRINVYQYGNSFYTNNQNDTVTAFFGFTSSIQLQTLLADTVREWRNILFSDKNFNGQLKEISFETQAVDLSRIEWLNFTVEVTQVSRAHYKYYKSLEDYVGFSMGEGQGRVFSNIQNGYGIFMSQAAYNITIPVK